MKRTIMLLLAVVMLLLAPTMQLRANATETGDNVTVDFSNLIAAIETCESYIPEAYTSASWDALEAAMEAGRAVVADPNATQKEVNEALTNLTAAQYSLATRGDKTSLRMTVESAEALDAHNYTIESWTALQDVLEDAKEVLDDPDAIQDQVDTVELALILSVNALVRYEDMFNLEQAITETETYMAPLAQAAFPAQLWDALAEALDHAKNVRDDEKATG